MTSQARDRKLRIVTAIAAVLLITSPITAFKVIRSLPKTERIQEQVVNGDEDDSWQCKNGEKISPIVVCDGNFDCQDKSDETYLQCRNIPCEAFQCLYGGCIPQRKMCDKKNDCFDESDEFHPDCGLVRNTTNVCQEDQFECDNHQCIDVIDLCSGRPECDDNSDETKELCGFVTCTIRSFKCAYGACVSKKKHCNGHIDCLDGSDEWDCPDRSPVNDHSCELQKHIKGKPFLLTENITVDYNLIRHSEGVRYVCNDGEHFVTFCHNGTWIGNVACKDGNNEENTRTDGSLVTQGPFTTQGPISTRNPRIIQSNKFNNQSPTSAGVLNIASSLKSVSSLLLIHLIYYTMLTQF